MGYHRSWGEGSGGEILPVASHVNMALPNHSPDGVISNTAVAELLQPVVSYAVKTTGPFTEHSLVVVAHLFVKKKLNTSYCGTSKPIASLSVRFLRSFITTEPHQLLLQASGTHFKQ